jgi:hypothetical protein
MRNNPRLSGSRFYAFIGFVLAIVVLIGWKATHQKKTAVAPTEGWVYMWIQKDEFAKYAEYKKYSGRPAWRDTEKAATVYYQLADEPAFHAVELPPALRAGLKPCPPHQEGVDGTFAGAVRMWNGDEMMPLDHQVNHGARVGDTVAIEVKNFDRWLFKQYDLGRLSEDFKDAPEVLRPILATAAQTRHCEDMLRPFYKINDTLRGALKNSDQEEDAYAECGVRACLWKEILQDIDRDPILKQIAKEDLDLQAKFDASNEGKARARFYPLKVWLEGVTERRLKQLTLALNGVTLVGLTPQNPINEAERYRDARPSHRDDVYHWLRFELSRKESSDTATDKEKVEGRALENAWLQLVGRPAFELPCNVTLRLPEQDLELPTKISKKAEHPDSRFYLIGIDQTRFSITLLVFIVVLFLLGLLIATTDILRDTGDRMCADGRAPLSLGKAQMAFWFVLTGSAFVFLWMTTDRFDTINDTCLVLLGIGSGTALGAAFIGDSSSQKRYLIDSCTGESRAALEKRINEAIIERLEQLVPPVEGEDAAARRKLLEGICGSGDDAILKRLPSDRPPQPGQGGDQPQLLQQLAGEVKSLVEQRAQLKKLAQSGWRRCLADFLCEGDSDKYSFHRFQMVGWTLLLGLVFVTKVLGDRTMPDFNATTLALLGISAGTYLGFKLPAARKEGAKPDQG